MVFVSIFQCLPIKETATVTMTESVMSAFASCCFCVIESNYAFFFTFSATMENEMFYRTAFMTDISI